IGHTHADSIVNGIRDSSGNGYDWRLAHAFGAKGAERGRYLHQHSSNIRHILAMRQRVIHQRGGEQLPVLVVLKAFEERPAKPLRDATVNLALNLGRIDGSAHILYRDVIEHAHLASVRIGGDPGKMSRKHGRTEFVGGPTTSIDRLKVSGEAHRGGGNPLQRDAFARYALDHYAAIADIQVVNGGFKHFAGSG